eukprot:6212104-Pleurochrysis_carterae.AAC.1
MKSLTIWLVCVCDGVKETPLPELARRNIAACLQQHRFVKVPGGFASLAPLPYRFCHSPAFEYAAVVTHYVNKQAAVMFREQRIRTRVFARQLS